MEIAHVITGHAILLSTLFSVIYLSNKHFITSLIASIKDYRFIRTADEKGVILLLIMASTFLIFILDFASSQAKINLNLKRSRNIKRSKDLLLQHLIILFFNFICAYIFRSLGHKVYNLCVLSVAFSWVNALFNGLIKSISTWGYFGALICNMFIFGHTFILGFDEGIQAILRLSKY